MDISATIKQIREKKNLSQDRFGKKLGLSGKTISAYETGKCTPPLKVMEEISIVYDTNISLKDNRERLIQKLSQIKSCVSELEDYLVTE